MRRLRIGILDLVANARNKALYSRLMNPNYASIMPQAVGVWCEEAGHEVNYVCFTGSEDVVGELPSDMDLLFVGAFTRAAQLAYAVSNLFRGRGAATVLGGPHARCYPDDARKYFDYVVGFTDKAVIDEILHDCSPHRPLGVHLSAKGQPSHLPGVRERWKFIEPTLAKVPPWFAKAVPMIASLGCPYTCDFCIDSTVPYQPLDGDQIREDLRFLIKKMPNAWVGWHDPNFGVRFDDCLTAIEDVVPPGTLAHCAESSLSLLGEANLKRLKAAGFKVMLPGIETWYGLGGKSKTGRKTGMEKVRQVSDHVNLILRYIPCVQTNFVLGLDVDEGAEPFELTKRFIDRAPGALPSYSMLSAFGEAAPLNLEFQRDGRVLPFPFHFLNANQSMNVRPRNYGWAEFYDHVIDLTKYSFSWKNIMRRARATGWGFATGVNALRAVQSDGFGRIRYHETVRLLLDTDRSMQRFFAGETRELPSFYVKRIREDLGPLWELLPPGALHYDANAYLRKTKGSQTTVDSTFTPRGVLPVASVRDDWHGRS